MPPATLACLYLQRKRITEIFYFLFMLQFKCSYPFLSLSSPNVFVSWHTFWFHPSIKIHFHTECFESNIILQSFLYTNNPLVRLNESNAIQILIEFLYIRIQMLIQGYFLYTSTIEQFYGVLSRKNLFSKRKRYKKHFLKTIFMHILLVDLSCCCGFECRG